MSAPVAIPAACRQGMGVLSILILTLSEVRREVSLTRHITDIADAAGICTRECQRIFRQYLHYSPIGYIRRKRIFNAAQLLSDTDRPVTDIALDCGFSNTSYFSKQFRELMGSTPGEYRASAKLPNK